jgi:NAD(P)-dependent dehydrogenase (short-subunit alcohol dehydrogenase family)
MSNLNGKTALVTGASRGIGRATALQLAEAGAQVLVHYSSSEKEADAVVAEIRAAGGRAQKVGADLALKDGPHELARQVRAIVGERLDILVANAGVSKGATLEETQVDDFDRLFAVNVRAPYFLVQQLLPDMSNFTKTDSGRDYAFSIQALKRLAQPEDIAGAILFLASDEARWVNGDTLRVDGGSKL